MSGLHRNISILTTGTGRDIRQIPDNQEVLLYPDSSITIIVEVLERVAASDNDDAIRYRTVSSLTSSAITIIYIRFHFDSLAHDNSSQENEVLKTSLVINDRGDGTPSAVILEGTQQVPKFNRGEPDKVKIYMALYRVEQRGVDLLVVFNAPIVSDDGPADQQVAASHFNIFTRSLRVEDFGLFAS